MGHRQYSLIPQQCDAGPLRPVAAIRYAGINLQRRPIDALTAIHSYTDISPARDLDESSLQCLYVQYPPYTATYLRDFLAHLVSVSAGNPVSLLTSLSEPGLYALTAALSSGVTGDEPTLA